MSARRVGLQRDPWREQLRKLLDWGEAHVTFDAAVKGLPPRLRGVVPNGLQHSAWQLVEHIRIAQADILEFCVNPKYTHKKWPDDYWPASASPKNAAAWTASLAAYRRDRKALQRLAADPKIDLLATIPWGSGQTYLREIVLVADHTAYHVGQLLLVRRALGAWT
jgi:DinB family protein